MLKTQAQEKDGYSLRHVPWPACICGGLARSLTVPMLGVPGGIFSVSVTILELEALEAGLVPGVVELCPDCLCSPQIFRKNVSGEHPRLGFCKDNGRVEDIVQLVKCLPLQGQGHKSESLCTTLGLVVQLVMSAMGRKTGRFPQAHWPASLAFLVRVTGLQPCNPVLWLTSTCAYMCTHLHTHVCTLTHRCTLPASTPKERKKIRNKGDSIFLSPL